MMYPRKPPTKDEPKSRKNLTQFQREELKRAVAERLSKKYGINNTDLIFGEVANYMNEHQNITAEGLKNLEENIKAQTTNNKNAAPIRQDDEESVKSGISKMSGASNFDAVDKYTQKKSLTEINGDAKSEASKTKKLQGTQIKKPENDLGFLDEENEWAAIYKYNRFLYDKEEEMKKIKKLEQIKQIRRDLDAQVEEKKKIKDYDKKESEGYSKNMQIQMERYDEKEKEKEMQLQLIKDMEKATRAKQIKDNKQRRRQEDKQQKQLDAYLMQKVKEELEAEQQYQTFKREHQAQVMKKLLQENEERKERLRKEAEQERQENIQLMDAYCRLIAEQEQEREKNIKEREHKMKHYQKLALEQVAQENEDKLGQMERRRERYHQRHEKKLDQMELDQKKKIKDQKHFMKDYLFKQMAEKDERKRKEKDQFNEQAVIWKKDNEEFIKFEEKKKIDKQGVMNTYASTLKEQMADNAVLKKTALQAMNENETLLNKRLLQELDDMRDQIKKKQQ
ncbi:hypothetical protein TTHERM_00192030 (macronuclear) [Tetrahymena thermophila SB210]|uniref:Uncharacterized protein n=1 Tax=Tetrahymena thermophila (strain SB210) TaxID=312017 RepID=I7MEK6_TETTS|nr:hypothetical protein TTHERM_00192030 [Tetrahymena thermophila SB210]EAR96534.1 hypothetical protein TTHERM_00192030 [Tetrahymena thermophila SB210]|eukprot:XP_001016779.1 hypothetical protein TTHERM_00192030 [Tetrahymena thermophila SB210]